MVGQPIGDDPEVLLTLNEDLNIRDACEIIHLLRADGSMWGGGACAEVLHAVTPTPHVTDIRIP